MVQRFGEVDRGELDLDDAAPALAGEVDAGVRHQAVQPVVERLGIAQPRQAAPCPDQGLLDGVLGQFRVAQDEAGRGIQARAGRADELGEGVPVASPGSIHEFRTVHGRLSASGTTMVAVLASLRRWSGREWFPLPAADGPSQGATRCQPPTVEAGQLAGVTAPVVASQSSSPSSLPFTVRWARTDEPSGAHSFHAPSLVIAVWTTTSGPPAASTITGRAKSSPGRPRSISNRFPCGSHRGHASNEAPAAWPTTASPRPSVPMTWTVTSPELTSRRAYARRLPSGDADTPPKMSLAVFVSRIGRVVPVVTSSARMSC